MYRNRSSSAFQQQLYLLPLEGVLGLLSPLENVLAAFVFNFRGWHRPYSQNRFCGIKYFHLLIKGKLMKLV